jgi:type II secretory pathway component PulK
MAQALSNDEAIRQAQIAGAVAEVDPQQIAIFRRLTPAQRFEQAVSMIELAEQVAVYRLRQQRQEMNEIEALRAVRSRAHDF